MDVNSDDSSSDMDCSNSSIMKPEYDSNSSRSTRAFDSDSDSDSDSVFDLELDNITNSILNINMSNIDINAVYIIISKYLQESAEEAYNNKKLELRKYYNLVDNFSINNRYLKICKSNIRIINSNIATTKKIFKQHAKKLAEWHITTNDCCDHANMNKLTEYNRNVLFRKNIITHISILKGNYKLFKSKMIPIFAEFNHSSDEIRFYEMAARIFRGYYIE
jgi:hypothetical protein